MRMIFVRKGVSSYRSLQIYGRSTGHFLILRQYDPGDHYLSSALWGQVGGGYCSTGEEIVPDEALAEVYMDSFLLRLRELAELQ